MSRSIITSTLAALLLAAPAMAVDVPTGSDTKLKVYGKVWATAEYFANASQGLHNDLFDSGTFADQTGPDKQFLMSARLSRFGFQTVTPSSNLGDVTAKIETDFKGAGNTLRLRHGFLTVGNWTVGQTWTTWFDLDAGADTVDFAGPIGAAPFDQSRVPMIRYTFPINKQNSLTFALENNAGLGDGASATAATATAGKGVGDQKYPNVVGVYKFAGDWGHVSISAVAQNFAAVSPANPAAAAVAADPVNFKPAVAAVPARSQQRTNKWAASWQVSGNVNIAKDNLYYSLYTGKATGPYGVGTQAAIVNLSADSVETEKTSGVMVGFTHNWTDAVRSNIVVSGVKFKDDAPFNTPNNIKEMTDVFVNTFVAITKSLDFGVEYVWQHAKAFGPGATWLDSDAAFTDKNNSSKIEVQLISKF